MRRLITTSSVSTQSWPSTDSTVVIQAKNSTPSTAPANNVITFCSAGIALGDMLIAENRDSLADVFYAKATGLDIGYSNNLNYISSNSAIKFTTNAISMANVQTVYLPSVTYIGSANANNKVATASDVAALGITTNSSTNNRTLSATGNLILGSNQSILLLPDGNVYIGNATDANKVVKKSDISALDGLPIMYDNQDNVLVKNPEDPDVDIILGSSNGGGCVYYQSATQNNLLVTKGYVDSAVANSTNTVITTMTIVGNVNASTNKVFFKSDGPLSAYVDNAGRLTFSDPLASSNLTELVNSDNGLYIHIGYAFVVTTAGTIPTPEGNVSLSVGDIILFKNDYPNETINNTFKWYKI